MRMLRVKFAIGSVATCIAMVIGIVFFIGHDMSEPKTPTGWNDRLNFFGGVVVTLDFGGWFDGTNMIMDAFIVKKLEPHMLKAKWRVKSR